MRVCAVSDLHGTLPEVEPCDILLIGGDICPVEGSHAPYVQATWLLREFQPWLESIPAKHIVGIAGNHDFVFEDLDEFRKVKDLSWTYLQDSEVTIEGIRIYGTPWTPNLRAWAFHGGMNNQVDQKYWDLIPSGIDILLSHGPMNSYGDRVVGAGNVGCLNMLEAVKTIKPKVFICGHIHEGRGHYRHPHIQEGVFNVSLMDEYYEPNGQIVDIPIERSKD